MGDTPFEHARTADRGDRSGGRQRGIFPVRHFTEGGISDSAFQFTTHCILVAGVEKAWVKGEHVCTRTHEHYIAMFFFAILITGSIARNASRRYLVYSEADFDVFRPTGVTR